MAQSENEWNLWLPVLGLVCGALVLFGAIMLRIKPENKKAWGILVIVFSIPSVVTGGGFIIGFILGIIGGASAFRETRMLAKTQQLPQYNYKI